MGLHKKKNWSPPNLYLTIDIDNAPNGNPKKFITKTVYDIATTLLLYKQIFLNIYIDIYIELDMYVYCEISNINP